MDRLDLAAAKQSLSNHGFRFTTSALPPTGWDAVTASGCDTTPWWIQQEEIRNRDEKIKYLQAQLEQRTRSMEQMRIQHQCELARVALQLREVSSQVQEKEKKVRELEAQLLSAPAQSSLLLELHQKMEKFERTIIPMRTDPSTRFIIWDVQNVHTKVEYLDPGAYTEGTNVSEHEFPSAP